MSRSRRSSPSRPNAAPIAGAIGDADRRGADHDRDRHVGDEAELDRATRRAVEQVGEVRGQRDQHRVDEQAATVLEPGRGHDHDRDGAAAEQLEQPGRDPTVAQRAEVAREPAIRADGGEVVDEPEEREAEHREEHLAARQRETGLHADAERAEHRASGLDRRAP